MVLWNPMERDKSKIYDGDPQFDEKHQDESYKSMQRRARLLGKAIGNAVERKLTPPPNRLLMIPRGGYFPADTLTRALDISGLANIFLGAKSYDEETDLPGKILFGQVPPVELVVGQNILIVDEVCDTGQTLYAAHQLMDDMGANSVISGVLQYKPDETKTGYIPNFWGELTDMWVRYAPEAQDELGRIYRERLRAAGIIPPSEMNRGLGGLEPGTYFHDPAILGEN